MKTYFQGAEGGGGEWMQKYLKTSEPCCRIDLLLKKNSGIENIRNITTKCHNQKSENKPSININLFTISNGEIKHKKILND